MWLPPATPGLSARLGLTTLALIAEAAFGYPPALLRAIGHPVMWIGRLIDLLDSALNRPAAYPARRKAGGVLAVIALLAATIGPTALVQSLLLASLPGWAAWPLLVLAASTLLAQRSLFDHVAAVGAALRQNGLAGGRAAVSHIVGRNPASLDEPALLRAAIESLAENFSDGVVAPAFWGLLGGLPGIAAYKAINTADSMIGHRTPRHAAFGWCAARLDDAANLPASRLAGLWLILAAGLRPGASPRGALKAMLRDAPHHRSPNAGWPEAAMAGALGLRLAGPRVYGETRVEDGWMGDGRADLAPSDLERALSLYRTACALQIASFALLWWLTAQG
jgi:adenosylcobinamide-phosphate synthase